MDVAVSRKNGAVETNGAESGYKIDIERLQKLLPHRYPMLMVDRIIDVVRGVSAIGIKNVTMNEPYFQGHFPGHPVVPGVMLIESMAQTSAALVLETLGEAAEGKVVYFMFIDNAKFRRPVTPGDQLRIRVVKERQRGNVWKFAGVATVDGQVVAEAAYAAMIINPSELPSRKN
ncbi:MAG TPA: 3-hydroxyacyl-ACP dehydratase FabZ [Acetobacteraceae bacterium]|jgi:3-hydroxyacyl-[acyl-carrier-protein] dehydratase|nr:3-hydroxyacyl-ACP dehydratase FabZ [Acetobacteraceae bacterium]